MDRIAAGDRELLLGVCIGHGDVLCHAQKFFRGSCIAVTAMFCD